MDKDWSEGLVIQCRATYYVTSGTYSNEIFSIKLGRKTLNRVFFVVGSCLLLISDVYFQYMLLISNERGGLDVIYAR